MIGDIIKEQRLLLDMSRKTLSEGICSEKYIYLIETNERNPSAYILSDLSDRLGIDLFEMDEITIDYITLTNAHAILAFVYQLEGQWLKAKSVIEIAYNMVKNKINFSRYNTVIITVLILTTSLLYNMEEYEELIKYGHRLMNFQEKYSEYNRFYYVDFYLSFAYYETNEPEKAFDHFMRGGYSALLFKNELDIYFITQMKSFKDVSKNLDIDPGFIELLHNII